ncbi:MAG: hypothetical protein IPM52_04180 [Bacteroidetes bacterium]|nr:hypothetical protein [Bacteroidota bacterium]
MKNKHSLLVLTLFLFSIRLADAQITINNLDFANPGDTLRTSQSFNVQGFDFAATGTNFTWNFASLPFEAQRLDTFFTIQQVPPVFLLSFFSVANLASKLGALQLLPGVDITNAWQFVNKGATNYRDWGYGLIIADLPLPLRFTTPDLLYNFPLSYNQTFSSNAFLEYPLPGVGYISIARNRQNHVDGWGALTTPYGTFQTLRLKSTVRESDSIYIDSIGQGIRIDRSYIEYKWLAKNQKIPLLVATVDSVLGAFVVYKDSLRTQTVSLPETMAAGDNVVYPQPFSDQLSFRFCAPAAGNMQISLFDMDGRMIYTTVQHAASGCAEYPIRWPQPLSGRRGLFVMWVQSGDSHQVYRLLRTER